MATDNRSHLEKMLSTYQARLEQLELQIAQQGPGADPSKLTEADELKAKVQEYTDRLAAFNLPYVRGADAPTRAAMLYYNQQVANGNLMQVLEQLSELTGRMNRFDEKLEDIRENKGEERRWRFFIIISVVALAAVVLIISTALLVRP